jgi:dolichol-phosphate mannosyltransferase
MTINRTAPLLSLIIPCYNEEKTLEKCVERVLSIAEKIKIEILIIDDCSKDNSFDIAQKLQNKYSEIKVFKHKVNQGKGAALHTGFEHASGDYVAIQDADLEYDPNELVKLLSPLVNDTADVVLGSRFLSSGCHRVLYYWHSLGNKFLTTLSNFLTDLNLTDMETCYKVFKREVIQSLDLKEKRFGFEPEVIAKIAQLRLRIYEIGISYYGRTYAEGKKINFKDGWRALYCILKYNLNSVPWPLQFCFYIVIGGLSAILNIFMFLLLNKYACSLEVSVGSAFFISAIFNYFLCIKILFRHRARWNSPVEFIIFLLVISITGFVDYFATRYFLSLSIPVIWSKSISNLLGLILNFAGRKWLVFPEPGNPDWKPQNQ